MSCFIVKTENLSKISNFIERLLNYGFNSFGFSVDPETGAAFYDCKKEGYYKSDLIFEELYKLNQRAYSGRYNDKNINEVIPFNPNIDIWKPRTFSGCNDLPQKWHYEILKNLQCLHYQLEEDLTIEDVKTKAIEKIINILMDFIISNNENYISCDWD